MTRYRMEKKEDGAGWAREIGEIKEQMEAARAQMAIQREENALLIRCVMEISAAVYG